MGLDKNSIEQSFIKNMEAGYIAGGNPEDFKLVDAQMMGKALAKTIVDHFSNTAVVTVSGALEGFGDLPTSATAVTDENPPWPRFQAGLSSSGAWSSQSVGASHWHEVTVTFPSAMPDANYSVVITPNTRVVSNSVAQADYGWVWARSTTSFKIGYDNAVPLADVQPLAYYYMAFYEENWDLDNGLDVDVTLNTAASDIHGAFNGSGRIE